MTNLFQVKSTICFAGEPDKVREAEMALIEILKSPNWQKDIQQALDLQDNAGIQVERVSVGHGSVVLVMVFVALGVLADIDGTLSLVERLIEAKLDERVKNIISQSGVKLLQPIEPIARLLTQKPSIRLDKRILVGLGILVLLAGFVAMVLYWMSLPDGQPTNYLTRQQLDEAVGSGNWFCFGHTKHEIGVNLPANFVVTEHFRLIEYWFDTYTPGEAVNGYGGATGKLAMILPISECPRDQIAAIEAWIDADERQSSNLSTNQINEVLGRGNWRCDGDNGSTNSVSIVGAIRNLKLEYPIVAIDSNDVKYGIGDTIDVNSGTVWIWPALQRDQCS